MKFILTDFRLEGADEKVMFYPLPLHWVLMEAGGAEMMFFMCSSKIFFHFGILRNSSIMVSAPHFS